MEKKIKNLIWEHIECPKDVQVAPPSRKTSL